MLNLVKKTVKMYIYEQSHSLHANQPLSSNFPFQKKVAINESLFHNFARTLATLSLPLYI